MPNWTKLLRAPGSGTSGVISNTSQCATLKFFYGLPDKATVENVYDNLDFMRGVEVFLNTMPAASTLANAEVRESSIHSPHLSCYSFRRGALWTSHGPRTLSPGHSSTQNYCLTEPPVATKEKWIEANAKLVQKMCVWALSGHIGERPSGRQ